MPSKLMAARYSGATYANIDITETLGPISELGIRFALPGGIQRVELTIRAKSGYDAYERYRDHMGQRIAIYDSACDKYIGCQIFECIPDGRHVTYICSGVWKRTFDGLYYVLNFPATGDTDAIIKDILTDSMSIDSTDQTNIAGSNVAVGGWTPDQIGTHPGDAIKELAAVGDSSDNIMDFYFVFPPFNGTQMQPPLPYLKSRSTTASPDWIFSSRDLAPDGLTLARHLWDLKTNIYIGYGRLGGTDDGADNNTLVDGGEDFVTDSVRPGDRVINITDDAVYEVDTVAATILTFTNGASGAWNNGDVYSIKLRDPKWTAVNSTTDTDWYPVLYKEIHMEMDQTQAEQYRDQLYTTYNDAQLQQAFVISVPTITDGNNARWPLWRVFMGDSFYFRINDLFPNAAVFGDADDREQTFIAVAMDYKYSTNTLRIVPSTNDTRLDSILNQAKIINGQIVSTERAWRNRKREEAAVARAAA